MHIQLFISMRKISLAHLQMNAKLIYFLLISLIPVCFAAEVQQNVVDQSSPKLEANNSHIDVLPLENRQNVTTEQRHHS